MRATPRLTIGLPVSNGARLLPSALDALLGQIYRDFELVISDNASADDTAKICREYAERDPRIRYLRQPTEIGIAANRNLLVGEARGELFKWASHDDLYAADYLIRCVEALDRHPKAALAHSWSVVMDERGTPLQLFRNAEATSSARAPERFRSVLGDGQGDWGCAVFRTGILRRTSPHRARHGDDRTMIAELALLGVLHQVPRFLCFHRDPPGGLSNPAAGLLAERLRDYVSAIRRSPLSAAEKQECYWHLGRSVVGRNRAFGEERETAPVEDGNQELASFEIAGFVPTAGHGRPGDAAGSAGPPGPHHRVIRPGSAACAAGTRSDGSHGSNASGGPMTNVVVDPSCTDDQRRAALYAGDGPALHRHDDA